MMPWYIAAVVGGLALLAYGAERFIYGAAGFADALGVSPLIIGLTVVGFGTSAPEMLVSGVAAWQGNPGLGLGNAIGSNIANVGLVLGVAALVTPLLVASGTLRREFPLLILVSALAYLLVQDGTLSRADSIVLLVAMPVVVLSLIALGGRGEGGVLAAEFNETVPHNISARAGAAWSMFGLLLLLASSKALVWGAVNIALAFNVSDLIIGLTIVAVGTSLPELAAAVAAAIRREYALIIGNIIGSNMFNLLAVIGIAGVIHPGEFPREALVRDMPVMLGLTAVLFLMAYGWRGAAVIHRYEGALLLAAFVGYGYVLYLTGAAV